MPGLAEQLAACRTTRTRTPRTACPPHTAGTPARPVTRIDRNGAMQLADANRRLARDVPGVDRVRAGGVRQIAAVRAHRDAAHAGRRRSGGRRSAGRARDSARRRCGRTAARRHRRRRTPDCPRPPKSPIQTTSTYGPTTPADQASRKPHDVPVFHATGQRARTGTRAVVVGPRIVAQHVERDEAGLRAEQARRPRRARLDVAARPQRPQQAAVGEHRVEAGELLHRDFAAAERERQAVERLGLQAARRRRSAGTDRARLLQLRRDPHGRDVAAANQRLLGA